MSISQGVEDAPLDPSVGKRLLTVLGIWGAVLFALCPTRFFELTVGGLQVPLTIAYFSPILVTVALLRGSSSTRRWLLSRDVRWLMLLHSIRFVGFGTILLGTHGLTSMVWSIPAGIGDMTTAAAMTITASQALHTGRLPRARAVFWNYFGMLDFFVILVLVVLLLPSPIGLMAGTTPTTTSVAALQFPFNMITVFGIPVLFSAHLVSLAQLRGQPDQVAFPAAAA